MLIYNDLLELIFKIMASLPIQILFVGVKCPLYIKNFEFGSLQLKGLLNGPN